MRASLRQELTFQMERLRAVVPLAADLPLPLLVGEDRMGHLLALFPAALAWVQANCTVLKVVVPEVVALQGVAQALVLPPAATATTSCTPHN